MKVAYILNLRAFHTLKLEHFRIASAGSLADTAEPFHRDGDLVVAESIHRAVEEPQRKCNIYGYAN
jgi:hypothetical protein